MTPPDAAAVMPNASHALSPSVPHPASDGAAFAPGSEWTEAIRGGDEAAFGRLFRRYAPGLCAHLARYVHSPAAAEDVVQDLFLTLWRKRADIHIDGPVWTYLLRAAKNRALNTIRSAQLAERFGAAQAHEDAFAPSEEAELLALIDLHEAVAALPPRCRLIFTLNRQQGHTYQKIADDLGISVKTVDTQMQRALKALRAKLHPKRPAGR